MELRLWRLLLAQPFKSVGNLFSSRLGMTLKNASIVAVPTKCTACGKSFSSLASKTSVSGQVKMFLIDVSSKRARVQSRGRITWRRLMVAEIHDALSEFKVLRGVGRYCHLPSDDGRRTVAVAFSWAIIRRTHRAFVGCICSCKRVLSNSRNFLKCSGLSKREIDG